MGTDIHTSVYTQDDSGGWQGIKIEFPDETGILEEPCFQPWYWRSYATFAHLAGVRNYKNYIPVLSSPRGFPDDVQMELSDWCHTPSWYLLSELLDADYQQTFIYGVNTVTLQEFMPTLYFRDLEIMKQYCDDNGLAYNQLRIVFYFDS